MVRKINFALLGCGRIAHKHAQSLSGKVPGARLVAVCDLVPERADAFAQKYKVPGFYSLEVMMNAMGNRIDAVNVLTPTGSHSADAIAVAGYKKHVVVEKPMALSMDDAEAMIEACDNAGVRLFVVKQNRYNKPVQMLRQAIVSGRLGKIVLATARVRWCREQNYYDQDAWRGTWLWDGGVFANQASHHIDLLHWLVGDVDSVFSYTKRQLVDIEAEDTGVAVMQFRCGALGVVEATTATRPKDLEASISILGEHGAVELGGFAVNEIKLWQFKDSRSHDSDALSQYNQNPPDVYGFGHIEYLKHVVDILNYGGPALVDGLEGLKSLRLINAMYESAEIGEEVRLRFTPKRSRLGQRFARRRDDVAQVPGEHLRRIPPPSPLRVPSAADWRSSTNLSSSLDLQPAGDPGANTAPVKISSLES